MLRVCLALILLVSLTSAFAQESERTFLILESLKAPQEKPFRDMRFGAGGDYLVALTGEGEHGEDAGDNHLVTWDAPGFRRIGLLRLTAEPASLVVAEHGQVAAVVMAGRIQVYQLPRLQRLQTIKGGFTPGPAAMSPDGRYIGAMQGNTPVLIDRFGRTRKLNWSGDFVQVMDFNPGGVLVAAGQSSRHRMTHTMLTSWTPSGKQAWSMGVEDAISDMGWLPGRGDLVTAGQVGVVTWHRKNLKRQRTVTGPASIIAVHPAGRWIAAVPIMETFANLINTATGRVYGRTKHHESHTTAVAFHPRGRIFSIAAGKVITVYDLNRPMPFPPGEN